MTAALSPRFGRSGAPDRYNPCRRTISISRVVVALSTSALISWGDGGWRIGALNAAHTRAATAPRVKLRRNGQIFPRERNRVLSLPGVASGRARPLRPSLSLDRRHRRPTIAFRRGANK